MGMGKPLLILCVDRDNDIHEKTDFNGPLIGREKNLKGATDLALSDPEDPDANAMFYAIKIFDKKKKEGKNVEIVTITGDKGLGYEADKEISRQLDKINEEINPKGCILVSDGASDDEIMPIIESRIKIDSTKIVFIKQAKELEKTYFVLLDKLRDPYFAKILLGIPALLLLLISGATYYGIGWEIIGVIFGTILLLRVFNIDLMLNRVVKDFTLSFEKTSWIGYIAAFAMFLLAIFTGYQNFIDASQQGLSNIKIIGSVIGSLSWILFLGVLAVMITKSLDALMEGKRYHITKYIMYTIASGLTAFVALVGSRWIVNLYEPYVDFGGFLVSIGVAMIVGYLGTLAVNWYRRKIVKETNLEGMEVVSERGNYLGKISDIDAKKGKIIIETLFNKRYSRPISDITSIENNVVVKSSA